MSNVLTPPDIKSLKTIDIPEAYRPQVTNFNQYLIDGALKTWNGNMADVFSTIRTENENGENCRATLKIGFTMLEIYKIIRS